MTDLMSDTLTLTTKYYYYNISCKIIIFIIINIILVDVIVIAKKNIQQKEITIVTFHCKINIIKYILLYSTTVLIFTAVLS